MIAEPPTETLPERERRAETRTATAHRPLIYLAGPYSEPDPVANTHRMIRIADALLDAGFTPLIPHLTLAWHLVSRLAVLEEERWAVQKDLAAKNTLLQRAALGAESETGTLAELHEQIRHGERRLTEVREEAIGLQAESLHEDEVANALREFDPGWEALSTREKSSVLELLIERVDYDGAEGTVAVTFRPTGIKMFQAEYQT